MPLNAAQMQGADRIALNDRLRPAYDFLDPVTRHLPLPLRDFLVGDPIHPLGIREAFCDPARLHRFQRAGHVRSPGQATGDQRATAKGLGLTYDQLRHCMKKHDLSAG